MKDEYDLKKLKKRPGKVKVDVDAGKIATSLRIDAAVASFFREEAERIGIPYQTLINSILLQYASGELVEKRTVNMLKVLMAKEKKTG